MKAILGRVGKTCKITMQKLIFTMQLYGGNGLANHAAAGAYGFLLSIAPILLLIGFIIITIFNSYPQAIDAIFDRIDALDVVIEQEWLENNLLAVTGSGITGVVSILWIFWAGRIFVLAIQRGLKIIFTGTKKRSAFKDTMITFAVEITVLLLALLIIIGSQTSMYLIQTLNFFPESSLVNFFVSSAGNRIFLFGLLGLVAFCVYIFIPLHSPRKFSALQGALFCALCYSAVNIVLQLILDSTRYNLLYGALGNLMIMLVNVYFFFMFLFLGAQLAYVIDTFDILFFIRMRQVRLKAAENPADAKKRRSFDFNKKLFYSVQGNLDKYLHHYKKDEIIFLQGDSGKDIFYIIEGEAEVMIPCAQEESKGMIITADSFFGEMGYLLSEERSATVKARTDASVLALPPALFDAILKYDANFDKEIMKHMSRRIKISNEQINIMANSAAQLQGDGALR